MRWRGLSGTMIVVAVQLVLVVGLCVALAGSAYAQSPSAAVDQYGTKTKAVEVQQPPTRVAGEESDLPNTGLSLLGVVLLGGGLAGVGIAVRRRERRGG